MNRGRGAAASSGSIRRWHIPPPLLHGGEPLEGGAILRELPGAPGLLLWQALRDVALWAEASDEERPGLFSPGAAEARSGLMTALAEGEIAPALEVLRTLLRAPGGASGVELSGACAAVAEWAADRGFRETALAFAQSAALANPSAPGAALTAARMAHTAGDHARAELWYRRATGTARRARAWRAYARSFSGLGALYQDRGNLPSANRFHLRALRGARRGGLRPEQAVAMHDLFGVAVEAGRRAEAERYAREALAAYPRGDRRLAALAHDVAYFWMEEGHFARALAVFQAIAPLLERPEERLWVHADTMRAAAGCGDTGLARRAGTAVRAECARPDMARAAARALLELARGELQLGSWEAAARDAAAALELAQLHREGRTLLAAEALLEAASRRQAATMTGSSTVELASDTPENEEMVSQLIGSLRHLQTVGSISKSRDEDPNRRRVKPRAQPAAPARR